jgi:hypothetical protein
MSKIRDGAKERYWRKLIQRQGKAGESIARFCSREGVSVHQFHWWRRTLRDRDRQATAKRRVLRPAFEEVASRSERDATTFVPVRLAFSASVPIEVVHPGGCVVRVPVEFDPPSLRRILAALDPTPASAEEN